MGEVIFKISDNSPSVSMTITNDKNITKQKTVAIEDLKALLVSDYKLATGLLPAGTRYYKGAAAQYSIMIELPAKVRDMTLSTYNASGSKRVNEIIQVPYPTCLFYFSIRANKIVDLRLNSLKYPLQSETDALYCFPFSNVYNDGRICWGSVGLPNVSKPIELIGIINLFLGSQFNGDLAGTNFLAPKGTEIFDFWTLIKHVKTLQEFPAEILKATSTTFKTLCKD